MLKLKYLNILLSIGQVQGILALFPVLFTPDEFSFPDCQVSLPYGSACLEFDPQTLLEASYELPNV